MNSNWNYPTTMWVGKDRIKDLYIACKTLNINKPLLVTDNGLAKSTIVIDVINNLKENGILVELYSNVVGNPTGTNVKDGVDSGSGVPIVSLYGANKKPDAKTLNGLDVVIFDVQDVGARFYTFLSTLHYIMETCAELGITVLVLDRPNPNGHYVDGPILDLNNSSFVGMHPVPIVHGMTVGEYAKMINGEGWLSEGVQCTLKVIPV